MNEAKNLQIEKLTIRKIEHSEAEQVIGGMMAREDCAGSGASSCLQAGQ
jgi:hypothetical protein